MMATHAPHEDMDDEVVIVTRHGRVTTLKLNRPSKRNAMSDLMMERLCEELVKAEDDVGTRVVVITGAGTAFCSGGDMGRQRTVADTDRDPAASIARMRRRERHIAAISGFSKPLVAALNGPAVGAGFHLALLCDLRLASDAAFVAEPFVDRGLIPDWLGIDTLPAHIGLGRAMHMMLTADRVDAEEAERIGLVSQVIPSAEFEVEVMRFCTKLSEKPPLAISITKRLLRGWASNHAALLREVEALAQSACQGVDDHKTSTDQFFGANADEDSGRPSR